MEDKGMPVKLGSFKDVLITTTCDVHPRMFEFYAGKSIHEYKYKGIADFWVRPWCLDAGFLEIYGEPTNTIFPRLPRLTISLNLCLLPSAYTTNQSFNGKILDPH